MRTSKWLQLNTDSLKGKTAAISGSTGGIGRELCFYLASLGASLVLIDRNEKKSKALRLDILHRYSDVTIRRVKADMSDVSLVKTAIEELKRLPIDILICNAGAYSIPRYICDSGYDNVFQINFVSPYMMIRALLPSLRERNGRVVIVGSIAHNYSRSDPSDVDFSSRKKASLVYGNSKRYLMFSHKRVERISLMAENFCVFCRSLARKIHTFLHLAPTKSTINFLDIRCRQF